MKRVVCSYLPNFPIQRVRCEQPALKSASCALYEESGNRATIVWASAEAIDDGIRPGMPLAEAQALEDATFLPHDPKLDAAELQRLGGLCSARFSPVVGVERSGNTHCLVLDITGCQHLFGGEAELTRQLLVDLSALGYWSRVSAANTVGAAWAIARYARESQPQHSAQTPADCRLESLPVEALRIPDKVAKQLREFDLSTIDRLLAIPRDTLPSRFGTVLAERLEQMFGRRDEIIEPIKPSEPVSAVWTTDEPINHPDAVQHICAELLEEVLAAAMNRGEGVVRLELTFKSESGEPATIDVGMAQPAKSAKHVMNVLQLKLETQQLPEWLMSIQMQAVTARLPARQHSLFDCDEPKDDSRVRRLIDRLSARLGQDAVVRPTLLPEPIPEQAVGYIAATQPKPPSEKHASRATEVATARPLTLLPKPERIDVVSASDGVPMRFQWNRQQYHVSRSLGLERIVTAWWQDTGAVQRDYRQIETHTGARFWLFRDQRGHWFLHGLFD